MTELYLLHLATPYVAQTGKKAKKVGHYVGIAQDVAARVSEHRATSYEWFDAPQEVDGKVCQGRKVGQGATIMGVVNTAGLAWEVARTWPGTHKDERRIKLNGHYERLCPKCRAARGCANETPAKRQRSAKKEATSGKS